MLALQGILMCAPPDRLGVRPTIQKDWQWTEPTARRPTSPVLADLTR